MLDDYVDVTRLYACKRSRSMRSFLFGWAEWGRLLDGEKHSLGCAVGLRDVGRRYWGPMHVNRRIYQYICLLGCHMPYAMSML